MLYIPENECFALGFASQVEWGCNKGTVNGHPEKRSSNECTATSVNLCKGGLTLEYCGKRPPKQ